ncbi:MAG: hypothetical protein AB7O24_11345 [Kofleriaceae bacterium]
MSLREWAERGPDQLEHIVDRIALKRDHAQAIVSATDERRHPIEQRSHRDCSVFESPSLTAIFDQDFVDSVRKLECAPVRIVSRQPLLLGRSLECAMFCEQRFVAGDQLIEHRDRAVHQLIEVAHHITDAMMSMTAEPSPLGFLDRLPQLFMCNEEW